MEIKAQVVDVELTFAEGDTLETRVGVIEGGFEDWMMDGNLEASLYFLFDEVNEIELNAEIGDGTYISKILSEPYTETETI